MRRNAGRLNYNRTLSPILALSVTLAGCSLAPPGTLEEQAKAERFSTLFEPPPGPGSTAARAGTSGLALRLAPGLSCHELRSAYFEWKAALARIDQAATWPNSNVALSFSYMFSPEQMKAWDRTTIGLGFDPSMNLSLPIKVQTAGLVALDAARQAGEKFRAVKFDPQRKALSMYLDLALTVEKIRIDRQNLSSSYGKALPGLVRKFASG